MHTELLKQLGPQLYAANLDQADLDERVRQVLSDVLSKQERPISNADRNRITQEISDDILGYGPIEPFLRDSDVSEVMVNGSDSIYLEKDGRLIPAKAQFGDEAHLRRTIDKIVSRIGRRVDESSPMVDARLPDGSRVNAVIPPLAIDGSSLTIRKFAADPLTVRRPDRLRHASPSKTGRVPRRLRAGPPQHHRVGQHRRRQDDDAERAVVVHPRGRAHRHDRGRRGAPAQAGPRGPAGVPPEPTSRARAWSPSATW